MARSQLEIVAQWELEKEQKLVQSFQQAQQYLQQNKNKLQGLEQYRLEYLQQAHRKATEGLGALTYGQHQSFIGKLDKACEQQTQVVSNAALVADQRKDQWLTQQRKRKAVEMLLAKQVQRQVQKEQRIEQNMLDEMSIQKFIRG